VAFLRKIKAGLVKIDIANFVGEEGNIFFNVETGELRYSDGVTPGGIDLHASTLISNTPPANPNTGDTWFDSNSNSLSIYYNGVWNAISGTGGSITGITSNNVDTVTLSTGYNFEPSTDGVQNLGSPTKKFGSLFLAGQTLYIGDTKISVTPTGDIQFLDDQDNVVAVHAKEIFIGDDETTILRRNASGIFEMVIDHGSITEQSFNLAIGYTGSQGAPGQNTINTATDVDVTNLEDGHLLIYAAATSKWTSTRNISQGNLDGGEY
jgi:hypothetical protein